MDQDIEKQADGIVPEQPPQPNRGWFRKGDRRINREGRPRGSKKSVAAGNPAVDCAPRSDRLMRFFVGERELTACLVLPKAPWIINLPPDFRIVASRFVAGHGAVFTIWSSSFPRIARGARIPAFRPEFNGLMYCANLRRADLR